MLDLLLHLTDIVFWIITLFLVGLHLIGLFMAMWLAIRG